MTRDTVRSRRDARREAGIKERLIDTLEDQPGDAFKRVCRRCGAAVRAFVLRPMNQSGAGGEVIKCGCGHLLDTKGWKVVRND